MIASFDDPMSKALNARADIAVDMQPATKPARRGKFIKELGHVGASLQELWLDVRLTQIRLTSMSRGLLETCSQTIGDAAVGCVTEPRP